MKKVIHLLLLNAVVLVAGLILIEIVWSVFYSNDIRFTVNVLADTYYDFDVSELYDAENGRINYRRDQYGFRGKYLDVKDIDILVVGGSTTDQRYIDDEKGWCRVLESKLHSFGVDATVVNAGVDGQSTYGHLKNFEHWFSQLSTLKPKYIMFYVGINDFYKDANYSYDALSFKNKSKMSSFVKGTFLYYLHRLFKGRRQTKAYGVGHKVVNLLTVKSTSIPLLKTEEYEMLMKPRLEAYLERLKLLKQRTKKLGAIPVYITQRKINHWIKDGQVFGFADEYQYGNAKYNGVDMHYMEGLLNDVTMSVCEEEGAICIDLASELEFDKDDFYDVVHNTPAGAYKVGSFLAEKVKDFYH